MILNLFSKDPSLNLGVSRTQMPATELAHWSINILPDFLSWGGRIQDSQGKYVRLVGPALVFWGVGWLWSIPTHTLWIPLTSGWLTLQRAAHFLFYLSISSFVISVKIFLSTNPASLYPLILKKNLKAYFSKLNVMGPFSTLFSLFVSLFYCSLACTSSQLSMNISFQATSRSLIKLWMKTGSYPKPCGTN